MNTRVRHHLVDLLESERCIAFSSPELKKIRNGLVPQNTLKSIVATMKAEGCGMAQTVSTHPPKILSSKFFSVFTVDSSPDNVFHVFLHGVSFLSKHKPATQTVLKRGTKELRVAVVETVLKTNALQTAISKNASRQYHRQFTVRRGSEEKMAFSEYSRKMRVDAFASFSELAALSIQSGIEIHVYDEIHPKGDFAFVARYVPDSKATKKKRFVIRVVRRSTGSHFDLLLPVAYHAHMAHGFWNRVDTHVLGRLGGTAVNSPQNVLAKLQASKNNVKNGSENNTKLPNENVSKNNNFSWNSSPKLNRGGPSSSPSAGG